MLQQIAVILSCATIGCILGAFGGCATGACPLMATWWRGALYGTVMGFLISQSLGH